MVVNSLPTPTPCEISGSDPFEGNEALKSCILGYSIEALKYARTFHYGMRRKKMRIGMSDPHSAFEIVQCD